MASDYANLSRMQAMLALAAVRAAPTGSMRPVRQSLDRFELTPTFADFVQDRPDARDRIIMHQYRV
jgi:hypothetical protein